MPHGQRFHHAGPANSRWELCADDASGYLELEELLLWWFKDNIDEGHIPTWDRADPDVALVEADTADDGCAVEHAAACPRGHRTNDTCQLQLLYCIPPLNSSIAFLYCIPLLHSSIAFLYCRVMEHARKMFRKYDKVRSTVCRRDV
eukprot:SAG31_NODE_1160_length_9602_cov_20.626434_2_plen_146_part_00